MNLTSLPLILDPIDSSGRVIPQHRSYLPTAPSLIDYVCPGSTKLCFRNRELK